VALHEWPLLWYARLARERRQSSANKVLRSWNVSFRQGMHTVVQLHRACCVVISMRNAGHYNVLGVNLREGGERRDT